MQINREGRVVFGDASLSVWEEGIPREWKAAQPWEREFKRQVFKRVIQTLNRLGWTMEIPAEDIKAYGEKFARKNRYCHKGDLQADLSIIGRCIEFKMFQAVNCPTRPDHEGRYEHNKEAAMPYLLRLEMEHTRRRIRDYLCSVFEGYVFNDQKDRAGVGPGSGQITALEAVKISQRESGHYVAELGRARFSNDGGTSGDGLPLENGMRVYAMDYRGRIVTGTAFYCLNGNWMIVTGRYSALYNVWHKQVWVNSPGDLRRKRNESTRRKRLEAELNKAIGAMDFRRAEVLRDIIFPQREPLFVLWHRGHRAYHRAGFSGYANDQMQAGKFTRAEVASWENETNVAVELGKQVAA